MNYIFISGRLGIASKIIGCYAVVLSNINNNRKAYPICLMKDKIEETDVFIRGTIGTMEHKKKYITIINARDIMKIVTEANYNNVFIDGRVITAVRSTLSERGIPKATFRIQNNDRGNINYINIQVIGEYTEIAKSLFIGSYISLDGIYTSVEDYHYINCVKINVNRKININNFEEEKELMWKKKVQI